MTRSRHYWNGFLKLSLVACPIAFNLQNGKRLRKNVVDSETCRPAARLWVSVVAAACVFPIAVIVTMAVWFIDPYAATPTMAIPSRTILAATPVAPVQAPVEIALLTPPAAFTANHPIQPILAQAEAPEPQPELHPTQIVKAVTPPPDIKTSEPASELLMFATLAVAPPMPSKVLAVYGGKAQAISNAESPAMPAKFGTEPLEELIPLPRPKPHIIVTHTSRTQPLSKPRPVERAPAAFGNI